MRRALTCYWPGDSSVPRYSSGKYDQRYIDNLRCALAEQQIGLTVVDKFNGWDVGGWSRILEIWRPEFWPPPGERYLALGLDTIITGPLDWLYEWDEAPIGLPQDPYETETCCDAVISYDRPGAAMIWGAFLAARPDEMAHYRYANAPSEMVLLRRLWKDAIGNLLEWPEPKRLLSYKAHVRDKGMSWDETSLVYFHGEPKPHELPEDEPLRKRWEG